MYLYTFYKFVLKSKQALLTYFRVNVLAFDTLDNDVKIPAPDSHTVFLNFNGVLGARIYDCDSALRVDDIGQSSRLTAMMVQVDT